MHELFGPLDTMCHKLIRIYKDRHCTKFHTRLSNCKSGAFPKPLLQSSSDKYYIFRVCVCVCYPACKALEPYYTYIVICGLSGSTIFYHIISKRPRLSKKKSYWTSKSVFGFLCNLCLKKFHSKKNWAWCYDNCTQVRECRTWSVLYPISAVPDQCCTR